MEAEDGFVGRVSEEWLVRRADAYTRCVYLLVAKSTSGVRWPSREPFRERGIGIRKLFCKIAPLRAAR